MSLDESGNITTTNGDVLPVVEITDIPATPRGEMPLAAIWIKSTDTAPSLDRIRIDLRFFSGPRPTGLGGACRVDGPLAVATDVHTIVAAEDFVLGTVYIFCDDSGSAGTTTVDVHLNGTTVFTTQANRPQLAHDDADSVAVSGTPEVTEVSQGDKLSIDIDAIATGARGLSVNIGRADFQ